MAGKMDALKQMRKDLKWLRHVRQEYADIMKLMEKRVAALDKVIAGRVALMKQTRKGKR